MNNQNNISKDEALASLNSLKTLHKDNLRLHRGPIWIHAVLVACISLFIFARCMSDLSQFWYHAEAVFALLLVIFASVQIKMLRNRGIKPSMLPNSLKSILLLFIVTTIFISLMVTGPYYTNQGYVFAPYLTVLISTVSFSFITYKYPTFNSIDMEDE